MMRNPLSTNPSIALRLLLVAATLALVSPAASAQYGTQLKAGDYGHVPMTKAAAVPVKVQQLELGSPTDVADNCFYLDTTSVTTGNPPTLNTNGGLSNKDLRLTPCLGNAAGTAITDADTAEKTATHIATNAKYGDVNSNGKFDKGDLVYVTTAASGDGTLASSSGPTSFTIRLTPAGERAAGTMVLSMHDDFISFGKGAAVALTASIVERDDKVWFLINHAANTAPFDAKGALVLENSLRVNSAAALQPSFKVTKLDMDTISFVAGSSFTAKAELQNTGKGAGQGIIVSKVNGVIVDAQLTPYLSPGDKGSMTMKGFVPMEGTAAAFEVGDMFKAITIVNGTEPVDIDADALMARLAALETELLLLKAEQAAVNATVETEIKIKQADVGAQSPAPDILWMGVLVAAVAMLRRRA